eukprot:snap_masked-scaffold_6-processed-gene-10.19-mRNA-1 protein AED:1.00 eAED:1.00 QI:0/0/0/0/1/1/2/0/155
MTNEGTQEQNSTQQVSKSRSRVKSSQYRGVSRCSKDGRWQARIRVGDYVKYLGRFKTEEEAARAYDRGAQEFHKSKAVLNFPQVTNVGLNINLLDAVKPALENSGDLLETAQAAVLLQQLELLSKLEEINRVETLKFLLTLEQFKNQVIYLFYVV